MFLVTTVLAVLFVADSISGMTTVSPNIHICPLALVRCVAPCKYEKDAKGCTICVCQDCRTKPCNSTDACMPKNSTDLTSGYSCVPITKLCCPKLVAPKICPIQNYCKRCSLLCNFMCPKGLKCCPDWYGCNRCVKPVPC